MGFTQHRIRALIFSTNFVVNTFRYFPEAHGLKRGKIIDYPENSLHWVLYLLCRWLYNSLFLPDSRLFFTPNALSISCDTRPKLVLQVEVRYLGLKNIYFRKIRKPTMETERYSNYPHEGVQCPKSCASTAI